MLKGLGYSTWCFRRDLFIRMHKSLHYIWFLVSLSIRNYTTLHLFTVHLILLPTKVQFVVWALKNINIFTW